MAQNSQAVALAAVAVAFAIVLTLGIGIGLLVDGRAPAAEAKINPKALNGYEIVLADSGSPTTATVQGARAVCPEGKGPIAGGYQMSGLDDDAVVTDNHPSGAFTVTEPGGTPVFSPDGWQATIKRLAGGGTWNMITFAACVDIDPAP